MPKTPTVTRSRTAAAMTSRRLDDQPTTSTDDSSATSSASSSRGRGRGRGRGKRGRALNKKDFSQQTLYCKGCGQIGHTVLLCEEEGTSNEPALTCSDCTRTHTLNAAEKSLTTNTILCSAPADPETLRKAKFLVDRVTELQTATGATLENSLSWLGVPAEEYERFLQIAETEMMWIW